MDQARDEAMMRRCIALARACNPGPDLPISAVVALGETVLGEATNAVSADRDVSRHAEIVALAAAQRSLGLDLSACTLYSLAEPCAMCALAIRETRIRRVVFAMNSPLMGGFSKWSILTDRELGHLAGYFGQPPEIRTGLLAAEAEAAFESWNPLVWSVMKRRGLFAVGPPHLEAPPMTDIFSLCLRRPLDCLAWVRHATRIRR
jgi:tRNA(adenine34) deaminase